MFSILDELKALYRYIKTNQGFWEAWPVLLILASAFLTAMVPLTIYQVKLAFFLGQYSFNYLEILAPFLILPVFFKVKKNKLMLTFAGFFFLLGIVTMPIAVSSPINSICVGYYTAIPFVYISCIRFTPFQKDLLKWGVLVLCLGLVAQVFIYGLGLRTYVSSYTGEALGVSGEVSRVNSTIGAATGSTVYIYMTAVLSSLLFIRRPVVFWSILIVSLLAMIVSQSRGATLMMLLYMAILALPMLRESRLRGGGFFIRVLLLACALLAVGGFLYLKPDVVEKWRKRVEHFQGDAFDPAGRLYRFEEAYGTFKDSNGLGVGWGNYSPRKKMMPFSQGVVGHSSPHNVYLLLLAEVGVVGFVGYLILIGAVLRAAWKSGRQMAFFGLLMIFTIGHNVEYSYLHVPFLWVFALLMAYATHRSEPAPYEIKQNHVRN